MEGMDLFFSLPSNLGISRYVKMEGWTGVDSRETPAGKGKEYSSLNLLAFFKCSYCFPTDIQQMPNRNLSHQVCAGCLSCVCLVGRFQQQRSVKYET